MTNGMLYIIRGLPGSGKTTLAKTLGLTYEADQFFMKDGEYHFDASKLGEAHKECQAAVASAMESGYTSIAVSNTFSRRWEMLPYYQLALEHNYDVTEITLTGKLYPSIHNVPDAIIQAMIDRWEK